MPLVPNTTCDVYRAGNAPPASPDVAAVPIALTGIYIEGLERGEGDSTTLKFTHRLLADMSADLRDGYNLGVISQPDTVWIPDMNGTPFRVVFTEIVDLGLSAFQHKRVFLARQTAPYPTNNL